MEEESFVGRIFDFVVAEERRREQGKALHLFLIHETHSLPTHLHTVGVFVHECVDAQIQSPK
jgi:hypothetical protein